MEPRSAEHLRVHRSALLSVCFSIPEQGARCFTQTGTGAQLLQGKVPLQQALRVLGAASPGSPAGLCRAGAALEAWSAFNKRLKPLCHQRDFVTHSPRGAMLLLPGGGTSFTETLSLSSDITMNCFISTLKAQV